MPVLLRIFCIALALLGPSLCVAAPSTYTGEAPVNSQSDSERAEALKTALANVVIAQTNDPGVLARADVANAMGEAERYVLQYQYRNNPPGEDGTARMTLVAQFDSAAVDRLLRRLGLGATVAAVAPEEAPSEATVWIGGIHNADDYLRVMGYLGKNNFVRATQPVQAGADGMLVKLSLVTGLAHFLDAVEMERTLGATRTAPPIGGADATLALLP